MRLMTRRLLSMSPYTLVVVSTPKSKGRPSTGKANRHSKGRKREAEERGEGVQAGGLLALMADGTTTPNRKVRTLWSPEVGPHGYCSTRHRMPSNSRNEGSDG